MDASNCNLQDDPTNTAENEEMAGERQVTLYRDIGTRFICPTQ
jgi:hypothetical protein